MEGVKIEEELTPVPLRCVAATCPSVFSLSDGNILIIGKKISGELLEQIKHKVGEDEYVILIEPAYLQNAVR